MRSLGHSKHNRTSINRYLLYRRKMTLALYRKTVIGQTLSETLDEMISKHLISREISEKILEKFDQVILKHLETQKTNKSSIKAHLDNYNNNDAVWTFYLSHAVIKTEHETINSDHMKIVACDKRNLENNNKSMRGGPKKDKRRKKAFKD